MPRPEMETRELQLFEFKRKGDRIEGVLLKAEKREIKGKPIPVFTIAEMANDFATFTGKDYEVLGTVDIVRKLNINRDRGKFVSIKWADTKATGQPTEMRIFDVQVSKRVMMQLSAPISEEFTDDDCPL